MILLSVCAKANRTAINLGKVYDEKCDKSFWKRTFSTPKTTQAGLIPVDQCLGYGKRAHAEFFLTPFPLDIT